jgi:hypothetical protein
MHVPRAAGVEEFFVIMQIEAVEIGALAAFDLGDAQNLALHQLYGFASSRLHDEFVQDFALAHFSLLAAPAGFA